MWNPQGSIYKKLDFVPGPSMDHEPGTWFWAFGPRGVQGSLKILSMYLYLW